MAVTPYTSQEWASKSFTANIIEKYIEAPFTEITNRALVLDDSATLKVLGPVERIHFTKVNPVLNETATLNFRVFQLPNADTRFRLVGNVSNVNNDSGVRPRLGADSFIECTFYGTGLNLLNCVAATPDLRVTIDGGVESANIWITQISILAASNRKQNVIQNVATGLSLGWHTIKVRVVSTNWDVDGVEILNESPTLTVTAGEAYFGGKQVGRLTSTTTGYATGITGSRGGRVVKYALNGTISQVVTNTNPAPAYLSSANHANEEIIGNYHFKEFGTGNATDVSALDSSVTNKNAALNDGSTFLTAFDCRDNDSAAGPILSFTSNLSFAVISFIGTGLDILGIASDALALGDLIVDGVDVGTYLRGNASGPLSGNIPIVSGLPYGSHQVRIRNNDHGAGGQFAQNFLVYGPKKPTIPTGAVELADYFVLADFAPNTLNNNISSVAQGCIKKHHSREWTYTGSWFIITGAIGDYDGGIVADTNTNGDTARYTFYGDALSLKFSLGNTGTGTVTLDGSTNLSGFTTGLVGSGGSFTAATGALVGDTGLNAVLNISGLTLGLHTIVIQNTSVADLIINSIEFHTPIHFPVLNKPDVQHTAPTGNASLNDLRKFDLVEEDLPNYAIAKGVVGTPNTTSNVLVWCPDMTVKIKTNGRPIEVNFKTGVSASGSNSVYFVILVDNVRILTSNSDEHTQSFGPSAAIENITLSEIIEVPAGVHTVSIHWRVSAGTGTLRQDERVLTVKEL